MGKDIVEETRRRPSYTTICPTEEGYIVYVATNGQYFAKKAEALAYQKRINSLGDFKKHFDFDKGNLERGSEVLAGRMLHNSSYFVYDHFWIRFTDEQLDVVTNFLNSHYKIPKGTIRDIEFKSDEWTFVVISNNDIQNQIRICIQKDINKEVEDLHEEIKNIKSYIPDFSNPNRNKVKINAGDSKFNILDLRKDK